MSSKAVVLERSLFKDFGLYLNLQALRPAIVGRIDHNSPASASGLQPGDSVVSINSMSPLFMTPTQLDSILARETTLTILYERSPVIDLISDSDDEGRVVLITGANKGGDRQSVIDLSFSSDDTESLPSKKSPEAASSNNIVAPPAGQKRTLQSLGEEQSQAAAKRRRQKGVVVKSEYPAKTFGQANLDQEVVELLPSHVENLASDVDWELAEEYQHSKSAGKSHTSSSNNLTVALEADFEIVGGTALASFDMPHQREVCSMHRFTQFFHISTDSTANLPHCTHCYCYVCEIPASTCAEWKTHCNATCKLPYWRDQQQKMRKAKTLPLMHLLTPAQIALYHQHAAGDFSGYLNFTLAGLIIGPNDLIAFAEIFKKLCTAFQQTDSSVDEYFSLLPILGQVIMKCRLHAILSEALVPAIPFALGHSSCTVEIVDAINGLFADSNALHSINLVCGFYRNPNNMATIEAVCTLPILRGSLDLMLSHRCLSMTATSLCAYAAMLPSATACWRALMAVAECTANMSADLLTSRYKRIILTLCSHEKLLDADPAQSFALFSDVPEKGMLIVAAIIVDLVIPVEDLAILTEGRPPQLNFPFISYYFVMVLCKAIIENDTDVDVLGRQAVSTLCQQSKGMGRTALDYILLSTNYEKDDYAVLTLTLLGLLVVQVEDFHVSFSPLRLNFEECYDIAHALSRAFCGNRQHFVSSELFLEMAALCGSTAFLCVEYADKLPNEVMESLSFLPVMVLVATEPAQYAIFDLLINAQDTLGVMKMLLSSSCSERTRWKALGCYLSPNQLSSVLQQLLPCLLSGSITESVARYAQAFDYMWKGMAITLYQLCLDGNKVYQQFFSNGPLPDISEPLLAAVSSQEFIQNHGIRAMLLLHTLCIVVGQGTADTPLLYVQEMRQRLDNMIRLLQAHGIESHVVAHCYFQEATVGAPNSMSKLFTEVYRLYSGGLLLARLNAVFPSPSPRNHLMVCMVTENWNLLKTLQFESYVSVFEVLGSITDDEFGWHGDQLTSNLHQLAAVVDLSPQMFIAELDAVESLVAELYSASYNMAYLVYTSLPVHFVISHATLHRPVFACGLTKARAEASLNNDEELVSYIDRTIEKLIVQLPDSIANDLLSAHRVLRFCAYVGKLGVCVQKYSLDLSSFMAFFEADKDLLSEMICYCPESVLELLLSQLIVVLNALPVHDQRYIARIESSIAGILPSSVSSYRFRREVLFYHYKSQEALQSALEGAGGNDSVVERLYSAMIRTGTPTPNHLLWLMSMLTMLGEEKLADFMLSYQLPKTLSAEHLAVIYGSSLHHVASMTSKGKGLVLLASILNSQQNRKRQICDPNAIPQAWLKAESYQHVETGCFHQVLAAQLLIWMLQDPIGAAHYIVYLRRFEHLAPEIAVETLDILHANLVSSGAFRSIGIEASVVVHYYRQNYRDLFSYVASVILDYTGVGRTALPFQKIEHGCIAIGTLNEIASSEILAHNQLDIPIHVVATDSFIRLCFDFLASLVRYIVLDIAPHSENGHWNALLAVLNELVDVITRVANGSQFVRAYLLCGLTLLNSFSPSMLTSLPEPSYFALMRCQSADPGGIDSTETLLTVMVRSISHKSSLRARLHLLTVLLHLQSTDSLAQLLHVDMRYSYFQSLVYSLCLDACYYLDRDTMKPQPLARGICTTDSDSITPSLLTDIIMKYGVTAVEVLEIPLLVSLADCDSFELTQLEQELGRYFDPMIFNPDWSQVCKAVAEKSPGRHRYFAAFAEPNDMDKLKAAYDMFHDVYTHCKHVFPHFRALLRMLVSASFKKFSRLANNETHMQHVANFASVVLCMCRDSSRGVVGVPFSAVDLFAMFDKHKFYEVMLLRDLLPCVPLESIAAVSRVTQGFTSEMAKKQAAFVLENADMVIDFWRGLLSTSGVQDFVIEHVIATISAVAQGLSTKVLRGGQRYNGAALVTGWIDLLTPYRAKYLAVIQAHVASACRSVAKAKGSLFGTELKRLNYQLA